MKHHIFPSERKVLNTAQPRLSIPLMFGLSVAVFLLLSLLAFITGIENWGQGLLSFIWITICSIVVWLILKKERYYQYRYVLFLLLAIGALVAIHLTPVSQVVEWPVDKVKTITPPLSVCHISTASILGTLSVQVTSAFLQGPWIKWGGYYLLGFGYLLVTLLLGTGWCAWACPYGAWDESAARMNRGKSVLHFPKQWGSWRHIGLGIFIGLILISLASREAVFCLWICPYKLTSQFWDYTGIYRWLQMVGMIVIGFGFVFILPWLTGRRTFCSFICPFGAWQSIVGRKHPFYIEQNRDKCIQCGRCQSICPMLAISSHSEQGIVITSYCIRCGRCIEQCPQHALEIAWRGVGTRCFGLPWPRIAFIISAVLLTGMLGIAFWGRIGSYLVGK